MHEKKKILGQTCTNIAAASGHLRRTRTSINAIKAAQILTTKRTLEIHQTRYESISDRISELGFLVFSLFTF